LHGQNDQLRLMRPDEQRGALDRFADVDSRLERYRKLRDAWQSARREFVDRSNRARELAQEADRLKFALHEIDTTDPAPGEDDALIAEIRRLSELDALREAASGARVALSGLGDDAAADPTGQPVSAADSLARARTALESTEDATLRALANQLEEALTVVADAAGELGGYLGELPADASTLDAKLARQAELRTLTRKYAADIDGVLQWAGEARDRLAHLDVSEEALAGLHRRVDELALQLADAASELSKVRSQAAERLAKQVTGELSGLAMADAEFTIEVSTMAAAADDPAALTLAAGTRAHAGGDGVDQVEFGFAAHRGVTVLPLAKSASGGELSRVMLALEVILAASMTGTTMVFDEVDAGVGGRAAVQIGRRLARLARNRQVIVVTHLPQVAAYADIHLMVDTDGKNGASGVRRLDGDDRVAELARMLAGLGDSDSARAHARELLEAADCDRIAT
jgi:DNA repair protein RecN (Recombination protein N)